MKAVVTKISLDITKQNSQVIIPMFYGDTNRELQFSLTENGKPYKFDNCTVAFTGKKADGTFLYNECEVDYNKQIAVYKLYEDESSRQTTACKGQVECQILVNEQKVINGETILEEVASPYFKICILNKVYNDEDIIASETALGYFNKQIQSAIGNYLDNKPMQSSDFNVKDFGAVGDGKTDDTEAFRVCLTYAKGRTVIVPKGTYAVNNCVVHGAVSLKGIDNPTIIRTDLLDDEENNISVKPCIFKIYYCLNAEISGITFDCNRDDFLIDANATYDTDGKKYVKEVTPEGEKIYTTERYKEWKNTACLYFYRGGKNINIHDCTFTRCSREGIYCKCGECRGDEPQNVKIDYLDYFENIHIHSNIFQDTSANFWGAYGDFKNVVFENNVTDNCRTMVVEFDQITNGVEHLVVRNNKMTNIAKSGVSVPRGSDIVIEGNYYTPKTTLDEHGRSSSDLPIPYLAWFLYKNGTEDVVKDVILRNNNGSAARMISVFSGTSYTPDNAIYSNFIIENNNFRYSEYGVRASYVDDLHIENNILNALTNAGLSAAGVSLASCEKISVINTQITGNINGARGKGNAVVLDSCKAIDLCYNKFDCVESGIIASQVDGLQIEKNILNVNAPKAGLSSAGVSLTSCENISVKNTQITGDLETEGAEGTETEGAEGTETEGAEGTETEGAEGTETEGAEGTETEGAEGTETEGAEGTETEGAEGTETEGAEGTETEGAEGTETEGAEGTETVEKGKVNAVRLESCKVIDLYYNLLKNVNNPLLIDYESMKESSGAETKLSVFGNTADWNKVEQYLFVKIIPFNIVGNNINLSTTPPNVSHVSKTTSSNKIYFSSIIDTMLLDTTALSSSFTIINDEIPVHAIGTKAIAGRTIRLIAVDKPIKLRPDISTSNIIGDITVPVGGVLTLTFNGSKWIAC